MSIQAVAWALDQDLPARAKLVLVSICNHADHTDGYCWLKAKTISDESSCKPRSVFKYIGALIRNGYIRKESVRGKDGKQRANDYWVLLSRPEAKWDWGIGLSGEDGSDPAMEEGDEEIVSRTQISASENTISCEPHAQNAHGENAPAVSVDKQEYAHGPTALPRTRQDSLESEPSESNPKESLRVGPTYVPRSYKPPPPQPLGAVVNEAKQIFVYEGTRAWEAWCAFKLKESGVRWTLSRATYIDGKPHTGWWFPSLFPPKTESAEPSSATEEELKEFANTS